MSGSILTAFQLRCAWPTPQRVPSLAQWMLSIRKPRSISSRTGGVTPRDSRKNDWLPQAATYTVRPSSDSSMPFAPAASLPGSISQPLSVCHSQSSPFVSPPIMACIELPAPSRGRKFVVMKPPSGRPRTEFRPIGSGAMAQPIQVTAGISGRVSTSSTSIDSRAPWPTTKSLWTGPASGST